MTMHYPHIALILTTTLPTHCTSLTLTLLPTLSYMDINMMTMTMTTHCPHPHNKNNNNVSPSPSPQCWQHNDNNAFFSPSPLDINDVTMTTKVMTTTTTKAMMMAYSKEGTHKETLPSKKFLVLELSDKATRIQWGSYGHKFWYCSCIEPEWSIVQAEVVWKYYELHAKE